MIEIEHLSKRFGSFEAISDLNLRVERGEVYGFLGPNGAGKTTTMKIMAGLMRPSLGHVRIGGIDVVAQPLQAKQITGYVPDRPFLYEKLTAREFLAFTAGIFGLERSANSARAEELLELFELKDWAGELIESYSQGMKQRLTMAAALLHRPAVLVVDEPMVGLDPRGAVLVKALLRRFSANAEGTAFLSTHSMEVAEELCDRVAILHHGKVIAEGTMQQLRARSGSGGEARLQELFLKLTGGDDVKTSLEAFRL